LAALRFRERRFQQSAAPERRPLRSGGRWSPFFISICIRSRHGASPAGDFPSRAIQPPTRRAIPDTTRRRPTIAGDPTSHCSAAVANCVAGGLDGISYGKRGSRGRGQFVGQAREPSNRRRPLACPTRRRCDGSARDRAAALFRPTGPRDPRAAACPQRNSAARPQPRGFCRSGLRASRASLLFLARTQHGMWSPPAALVGLSDFVVVRSLVVALVRPPPCPHAARAGEPPPGAARAARKPLAARRQLPIPSSLTGTGLPRDDAM